MQGLANQPGRLDMSQFGLWNSATPVAPGPSSWGTEAASDVHWKRAFGDDADKAKELFAQVLKNKISLDKFDVEAGKSGWSPQGGVAGVPWHSAPTQDAAGNWEIRCPICLDIKLGDDRENPFDYKTYRRSIVVDPSTAAHNFFPGANLDKRVVGWLCVDPSHTFHKKLPKNQLTKNVQFQKQNTCRTVAMQFEAILKERGATISDMFGVSEASVRLRDTARRQPTA